MNICWYLMDLEKSLNITLNSAQVQGLNSVVAHAPGPWEGWIFISNWHWGFWRSLVTGRSSGQGEEEGEVD